MQSAFLNINLEDSSVKTTKWFVIGWALGCLLALGSPANAQQRDVLPPATEQEMQEFYNKHLKRVIEDQFMRASHPIPAFQERIVSRMNLIHKKSGKHIEFFAVWGYIDNDQPWLYQDARINADPPHIRISIVAYMNRYRRLQDMKVPNADEVLEGALAIGLMHELDHLALDLTNGFPQNPTKADMIQAEIDAWAETAEHAIRVFAEAGRTLDPSDDGVYQGWMKSGRSAFSSDWIDFVQKWHADGF